MLSTFAIICADTRNGSVSLWQCSAMSPGLGCAWRYLLSADLYQRNASRTAHVGYWFNSRMKSLLRIAMTSADTSRWLYPSMNSLRCAAASFQSHSPSTLLSRSRARSKFRLVEPPKTSFANRVSDDVASARSVALTLGAIARELSRIAKPRSPCCVPVLVGASL